MSKEISTISLRIEKDFKNELEEIANKRRLPLSTFMRLIIADHYKEYDPENK